MKNVDIDYMFVFSVLNYTKTVCIRANFYYQVLNFFYRYEKPKMEMSATYVLSVIFTYLLAWHIPAT